MLERGLKSALSVELCEHISQGINSISLNK